MLTGDDFVGPWAGPPVAWTDDDKFDEATYRVDLQRLCDVGVPGIYTAGTTGEFYAMELDEWQTISRVTVAECKARKMPVMIGCTNTYTIGAVRRAAYAAELGADAIQVALPFWMAVEDAQVVPFFKEVSEACGGLAVSIYDITRTKKPLSIEQHRSIKEALPNYLMVKTGGPTPAGSAGGCRALSELVSVFVGEESWGELCPVGANGSCSSVVYWNPRVILGLWKQVEQKNWPAVEETCGKLKALFKYWDQAFAGRGLLDSAGDRLGGVACGFLKTSLRSRGPYPSATQKDVQTLRQGYKLHFPEMLEL